MRGIGLRKSSGCVIGVIGGGAAGVLTTLALARSELPARTTVVLFEPRAEPGAGLAYSTTSPAHLLNVPAGKLGAHPDDPAGFTRWLQALPRPAVPDDEYVARDLYARYLYEELVRLAGPVQIDHHRDRVSALHPTANGVVAVCTGGRSVRLDAAVLAVGNLAASTAWAPRSLPADPAWIGEPWRGAGWERARSARSVVLVGSGLTAIDVAIGLADSPVTLTALSPSGRLPAAHKAVALPPIPAPPELTRCHDSARIARLVARHVRQAREEHGDWRPAIDGLRPITATIWQGLSENGKSDLLGTHRSWWNKRRHRIPPRSARQVTELIRDGRLTVRAGRISDTHGTAGRTQLTLSDGSSLVVDAVINCMGAEGDLRRCADPLIGQLLHTGLANPGPLGLGLATTSHGQLRSGTRLLPAAPVYTLGASRIGELWETTAIPEIRSQAAALAEHLARDAGRHSSRVACPTARRLRVRQSGIMSGPPPTAATAAGPDTEDSRS